MSPTTPENYAQMTYLGCIVGYSLNTMTIIANFTTLPKQQGYIVSNRPDFRSPRLLLIWISDEYVTTNSRDPSWRNYNYYEVERCYMDVDDVISAIGNNTFYGKVYFCACFKY
jgi:hypothetical protein